MLKTKYLAHCVLIMLAGCARQVPPSGGPRDRIPPHLKSSIPANEQTNYRDSKIELTFDEYVQLNDPDKQIIVTPRIGKRVKAVARKNKIYLQVDEAWADSTTYTVNFREAVQDLTEKNPAQNLKLAFSTGPYIDSLSIAGSIKDALTDLSLQEVTVGTITYNDTINIFEDSPEWFGRTDKAGTFILENLKPGTYILFALDDENKNLLIESRTERYGFEPELIILDSNVSDTQIRIQRADNRPLRIIQSRPFRSYTNIRLSVSARTLRITSPELPVISCFGEDPAQLRLYPVGMHSDSIPVILHVADSLSQALDTAFYIKLDSNIRFAEDFAMHIQNTEVFADRKVLRSKITFNKPLVAINYDSLVLQLDSLHGLPLYPRELRIDTLRNMLSIEKVLPDSLFEIVVPPAPIATDSISQVKPATSKTRFPQLIAHRAALISAERDSSSSQTAQIQIVKPEMRGIISAQVQCRYPFTLQLLDKSYKVVQELQNTRQPRFENLLPNQYQIRLLVDMNSNGFWDPGNYYQHTRPEPVLFYKNQKGESLITIKANWEVGPLLITYE